MISVPSRTKKRSFFRGQRNLPTFQLLAAIVSSAIGGCVTSLAGSRFVGNGDGTAYITVEKLCGRYSGRGRATYRRGVRPGEEERAPGYELCVCRVATFLPLFSLSLSLSLSMLKVLPSRSKGKLRTRDEREKRVESLGRSFGHWLIEKFRWKW